MARSERHGNPDARNASLERMRWIVRSDRDDTFSIALRSRSRFPLFVTQRNTGMNRNFHPRRTG
jgi:hypothetical protein